VTRYCSADKEVCVTGPIRGYKGVPEIVATHPKQITDKK
jgi:hypothetical protein